MIVSKLAFKAVVVPRALQGFSRGLMLVSHAKFSNRSLSSTSCWNMFFTTTKPTPHNQYELCTRTLGKLTRLDVPDRPYILYHFREEI